MALQALMEKEASWDHQVKMVKTESPEAVEYQDVPDSKDCLETQDLEVHVE